MEIPDANLNFMSKTAIVETDSEVQKILKKCIVSHTPTSIEYHPDTTYEEWEILHHFYDSIGESSLWWKGDSIRHGQKAYGEKYTQAIDLFGKEYSTLTSVVSICERFSDVNRRRNTKRCGFWMCGEVAYLPPQEADYLLDQVERGMMNRQEVRDAVARKQGRPTKAEKDAAKEAKKVTVTVLQPANSVAAIDVHATVSQVPETPKPPIWNGYPVTTSDGMLFAGDAVPMDDQEAEKCAHQHGHATAADMVAVLASALPEAPKTDQALPMPPEQPKPAQPTLSPTATPLEDQHVAVTRLDAAIERLKEAILEVDTTKIKRAKAKLIMQELEPVDEFIDVLSKIEEQPAAVQGSLSMPPK